MSVVVAHQGGWDEILLVAAPIALFAFLLWLANRRAERQMGGRSPSADAAGQEEVPPPPSPPSADPADPEAAAQDRGIDPC